MAHPLRTEHNTLGQMLTYRHDQGHRPCTQEALCLVGEAIMEAQNGQVSHMTHRSTY